MRRLNRVTGLILSTLMSLVLACGEVEKPAADAAPDIDAVSADAAIQCTAPEELCGVECVDTQIDEAHCGDCDTACSPAGECIAGECAEPLAVIQTDDLTNGVPGDAFVLQDMTLGLTQLNTAVFATGRVVDHAVLPDGSVLLVAAENTESAVELYRVQADGTGLTRVSPALTAGRGILPGIQVSNDGTTVLYRANQDDVNVVELYVVDLANPGVSHKVNGTLAAGGTVSRVFRLSADGNRAAYIADQQTQGLNEAYTVDLSAATPGASIKLNAVVTNGVFDLELSGDGANVVYRTQDNLGTRLYAVKIANPGAAVHIANSTLAENSSVLSYRITPAGDAVIMVAGTSSLNEHLWRATFANPGTPTALTPVPTNFGDNVREDFAISSDGSTVYFRQAENLFDRLYSVSATTPGTPKLLSDPAADTAVEVTDFAIAPDDGSLVFRAGADGAEGPQSNPRTDGPLATRDFAPTLQYLDLTNASATAQQASRNLVSENGIGPGYVALRNGGRALYRADHDNTGRLESYLTTVAPDTVVNVSPVGTGTASLSGF